MNLRTGAGGALLALVLLLTGAPSARAAERLLNPEATSRLQDALRAMDKGDWQWARRQIDRLRSPPLSLYARWRELLEADPVPGFAQFSAFLTRYPDWPSLAVIQARAEARIDEDISTQERLAFFSQLSPRTRQGRIRYAQALLESGRTAEADQLLRQAWTQNSFPVVEEQYFLSLYRDRLRPSDHAARLDNLLWDGETVSAQRMLPFVDAGRRSVAVARIRMQGLERRAEAALAEVPAGLRNDPGLVYERIRWSLRRGRDAEALPLLTRPPQDLVRPDLWWDVQSLAIRDLMEAKDARHAYEVARTHRQTAGVEFAEAEWLAGWIALRSLNNPEAAAQHFSRLWQNVRTPISRGRAAYWAGRAAIQGGNRAAALAWDRRAAAFPTTFYGQLGAREAGIDLSSAITQRARSSAAARERLKARAAATVARLLCEAGGGEAQPFFRHLGHEAANDADTLRAVVELGESCGRADMIVIAMKAAIKEGGDVEAALAYPVPAVRQLRAQDDGLPEPALRMAVARQESQFDPRVQSPAGAMGLMQVMPATAEAMAGRLGLPYSKTRLRTDAAYNALIGSSYLKRQLERFGDEPVLALAAYNAGPSRVAQWLDENGDPRRASLDRMVDWIELIPFAETRNYVQRVIEANEVYRVLLSHERVSAQADTGTQADTGAKPAS